MRFDLRKLITAVHIYETRLFRNRTTSWACQKCGEVNPYSEWICLYCSVARTLKTEDTLDTGASIPDPESYRPRTIVRDGILRHIERSILAGRAVPGHIWPGDVSLSGRLSRLAATMYAANIYESQGEARRERDEELDLFGAMLDEMDESGVTDRLLAEVWKEFRDEAVCMGLPSTTDLDVKHSQSIEQSVISNGPIALESGSSRPGQAGEDGPIPDGFRYRGKSASGLSKIPWNLLSYLWMRGQDGATYDDLAEHVWGDSQRDGDAVKSKFRSPQSVANKFLRDNGFPWEISAGTKPHLKQKPE